MNLEIIITEYEQRRIQGEKPLSSAFFSYNEENNHKLALGLFRHVIEKHLRWKPEDIATNLNLSIIEEYDLLTVYRYVIFPDELSKKKDFFYIGHLLYPDIISYDMRTFVIDTYRAMLNDAIKYNKSFFTGEEGELRACLCLQYILIEHTKFSSIEEIYFYFSSKKAMAFLRKYHLSAICRLFFDSPLDYVHNSIPPKQRNELYYQFYRFDTAIKAKKLKTKLNQIINS